MKLQGKVKSAVRCALGAKREPMARAMVSRALIRVQASTGLL
jgi:hypothetical protein